MQRTFRSWRRRPWWFWRALADRRDRMDAVAPTLSGLAAPDPAATSVTLEVTTDRHGGTIFAVVVPAAAAAPDATQVAAGTDGGDDAASWAGSRDVGAAGEYELAATGLTTATQYMAYAAHRSEGGTFSAVASQAFTTA